MTATGIRAAGLVLLKPILAAGTIGLILALFLHSRSVTRREQAASPVGPVPAELGGPLDPPPPASAVEAGKSVFEEFFWPFAVPPDLRDERFAKTTWQRAVGKYTDRDYQGAIRELEACLAERLLPDELVRFFLGQAHLALGEASPGIAALAPVLEASSGLAVEARWYLALAEVRRGAAERAKAHVQQLIGTHAPSASRAEELLRELVKLVPPDRAK